MKKILITGGAGFIGYHLAKHLLTDKNNQLTLVDNLLRGRMDDDFKELLQQDRVKFLNLDLTDQASYDKFGSGYEQVYHLAAINGTSLFYEMPQQVLRVNTLSLIYMLDWMKEKNQQGKFCFTSSNEAYGGALKAFNQLPIPTPEKVPLVIEDTYNPRWSYASTKLVGELFVINYCRQYDFRGLIVRPHNFYGPRAGYNHVIPELSLRIAAHKDPFELFGQDETRTFLYITDAVKAMQQLMDATVTDSQPIETVHIGNNDELTMLDMAKKFFAVVGWTPKELKLEAGLSGSVKRRLADITKIKQLIGWQPETKLADGLRLTFEWYKKHPE